ncbi:MAG TPA: GDSL-type esterase/lipase family protein [Solirubrobacteraceae bacterium]|nr:GDSL-type esterase/lipase family protein [Solirubrobacteraceae bacterium]
MTHPQFARLDQWWVKLTLAGVVAVATLVALALGGEFLLRYREAHRAGVPGTMPFLYYRHGRLGYALIHNRDYFGWAHIDGEGFRGRDVSRIKDPGVARIMVVGGSTAFDSFVSRDSAAWPARLEAWLRVLAPEQRIEVINAGVPGYMMIDHVIRLETELFRYKPDVLLLYDAHNDLFAALRRANVGAPPEADTPNEVAPVTPWGYWLDRHSLLYTKMIERWNVFRFERLRPRSSVRGSGAGVKPEDADSGRFARDVSSFLAVAQALGIRVVLADVVTASGNGGADEPDSTMRAVWWHTVPFAPPGSVLRGYARYRAVLRDAARTFSLPYIETDGFGLTGPSFYAEDDPIHFNDAGADRMGHEMAAALLQAGVLPHRGTTTGLQALRATGRSICIFRRDPRSVPMNPKSRS